jgi:putative redox protein
VTLLNVFLHSAKLFDSIPSPARSKFQVPQFLGTNCIVTTRINQPARSSARSQTARDCTWPGSASVMRSLTPFSLARLVALHGCQQRRWAVTRVRTWGCAVPPLKNHPRRAASTPACAAPHATTPSRASRGLTGSSRLAHGVRAHATTAGMATKAYHFSGGSTEDGRPGCTVHTNTGHTITTDLPKIGGGRNASPQPVELLIAALLGCKVATAHYVARHLFPRPHNRLASVRFSEVVAERDERGALALPLTDPPPTTSALTRVRGVVTVVPSSCGTITSSDIRQLGELVEQRCPVAATLLRSGCALEFEWLLGSTHD